MVTYQRSKMEALFQACVTDNLAEVEKLLTRQITLIGHLDVVKRYH